MVLLGPNGRGPEEEEVQIQADSRDKQPRGWRLASTGKWDTDPKVNTYS